MIALRKTFDWFETPVPVSSEKAATSDWAISSDRPIVISGSTIVMTLR